MNKWIELLLGLVLLVGAILLSFFSLSWGRWDFGHAAWQFLKGGIVWFVVMVGLLFIMLGISDLKE